MKRMLFNATQAEELRVAIVDGQKLVDLDIETVGKEQRKGNIYKGTITRIEPSLEACFVDYGTDRHGFLPFKEVSRSYFQNYEGGRPRIQEVLKEGQQVIVQVEKDERGNKGAALTTYVSLAGRYLVLMPNNPRGGGVSRRIEGEERQELKELMAQLNVPHGMSLIARTAGIGRNFEELQWDLSYLLQLWRAVENAAGVQAAPFLILQESSLVIRAIRDYYQTDIGEILIDTPDVYEQARQFMTHVMPGNVNRVKMYNDHVPLFSRFQIEHQIETAYARSVQLPSGGGIVIDHTEALVSIDVNSARATKGADIEETALKTNLEAAEEIARQLRLRDLGGLIVIDFIDMENPKSQREVETLLRDSLKQDRARVQMGKLSRFGLLELSRQRLQPSLGESSHIPCPRCHGIGFIRGTESSALHILRILQEEAMKENTGAVHAQVPVDVATFLLNEKRTELYSMEERLGVNVLLIPNIHLETPHYKIVRVRNDGLAETSDMPSYQRVEAPEEENAQTLGHEKPKAVRLEAAVKGITPQQPAPEHHAKTEDKGFIARVFAWFRSMVAEPEEEKKPAPVVTKNNREARHNRQQNGANRHAERRQGTNAAAGHARNEEQQARRAQQQEERRKQAEERREKQHQQAQEPQKHAHPAGAEHQQPEGKRKERRERKERLSNTEVVSGNKHPVAAKANTQQPHAETHKRSEQHPAKALVVEPVQTNEQGMNAVETGENVEKNERRRRRNRRDRRRDEPNAAKEATVLEVGQAVVVAEAVEAAPKLVTHDDPVPILNFDQLPAQAEVSDVKAESNRVIEQAKAVETKVKAVQTAAVEAKTENQAVFAQVETQVETAPAMVDIVEVVEDVQTEPTLAKADAQTETVAVTESVEQMLSDLAEVANTETTRVETNEAPVVQEAAVQEPVAVASVKVVEEAISQKEPVAKTDSQPWQAPKVEAASIVEVPVAAESVSEPVHQAQETVVKAEPVIEQIDLGHLVMVSTKKADAELEQTKTESQVVIPQVKPARRRRDMVKAQTEAIVAPAADQLKQVETGAASQDSHA